MSDKNAKPESDTEAPPASGGKKKPPIVLIAGVALAMIVEGVAIFLVVGATGKKPAEAAAAELHGTEHADQEVTAEVELLAEEFQTMQGSQIWIWDTHIVLKVKEKNREFVEGELERRASEIREAVATMFRRSQPTQLREPGLETLNRQISAYLEKVVGKDPEGHERIERVMIPRCRGFAAN